MSILKVGMYASQFPTKQNYLTFSSDASFSIKFNQISWDGVLEYSLDAQNWYEWDASEINSVDGKLYLRGSGNSYITGLPAANAQAGYEMQITATEGVECSGNIMSLLNHANPDNVVMGGAAFASLFYEQDKLITSPELPATELVGNCYRHMFRGTGIVVAPELPATVLATYCYGAMFQGCINLKDAPELPATVLAVRCYASMFHSCTSLTYAPELPAMVLTPYCYAYMLQNCTNLKVAPELPATALAENCYDYMFQGCSNLTVAPELPATVLAENCYRYMFHGTAIAISETPTGIYQTPWSIPSAGTIESEQANWNTNMLALTSGTFTGNPAINTTYYQIGEPVLDGEYITFTGNLPFKLYSNLSGIDGIIEYSVDKINWVVWNGDLLTSQNNQIFLRGIGGTAINSNLKISWDGAVMPEVSCTGNIMTLLDYNSPDDVVMGDNCFNNLFYQQTALIEAPQLPATTLSAGCYSNMFYGTSIINAPGLPATTLAVSCYNGMFRDTGIEAAPELPATVLANYCYAYMFLGCINLTAAPELPAATLAVGCYQYMFEGCINLTDAPELPAIVLAENCYTAMLRWSGIAVAPELPATTLAKSCYANMFYDCMNLITAPALPAMVLAENCYTLMFYGCTNLTVAPELPATELAEYCYHYMFFGSGIAISETQTGSYQTSWRIPSVGSITSEPIVWNTNMLGNTSGTFTGAPDINTTYYQAD